MVLVNVPPNQVGFLQERGFFFFLAVFFLPDSRNYKRSLLLFSLEMAPHQQGERNFALV
jgi:hypothetical protein